MKKFIPFLFLSTIIGISIVIFNQQEVNSNASGAPSGRSGAPGESNCSVSCHTGASLNSGSAIVSITSTIPSSGFVAGETYSVTATVSQAGISKFGFEISAEGSTGSNTGSWIITNSTQTKIVSSNYVTHKSAGTSGSGSKSWSMNWKAPCAGSDTVIFYCAYNVTNSNQQNSGDTIYTSVRGFDENLFSVADTVGSLVEADVSDTYDGRDLRASFRTSKCETRTGEYRVMAVKQANAASFTISAAGIVAPGNYKIVSTGTPNTTKVTSFGQTGNDVDGDAIRNNETYKIFVLSIAKSSLVNRDTMLASVNFITLTSPMVGVSNITGSDVGNTGNASDLETNFDTPANEGTVDEYRTIIVKSTSTPSFTLTDANALASNLYKITNTGNPGSTINLPYQAGDMDSDGDTLEPNTAYSIFQLTKADGVNSLIDSLQQSDSTVMFDEPVGINSNTLSSSNIEIISYNGSLRIITSNIDYGNMLYEIYNTSGQQVTSGRIIGDNYIIDINQYNLNIGIIRLVSNDQSYTRKFVK